MSLEQLSSLIKKLQEEHIYVNSEKKHLVDLHRQVLKKAEQLFRKSWIISYQRLLLDDLIFGRANTNTNNLINLKLTLNQYCTKYTNINKINFIESYKSLSYNDYNVSEFLKQFKDNPKYLAYFLVKCEKLSSTNNNDYMNIQNLIPIIFSSLYANCLLANDELLALNLLKQLIELQFLDANVDLRRLIRKQSCSFNIIFKFYTENVFSTRLFLTATLHEPILQLLMQDEWFYDIDPNKALDRFSPEERLKRFGDVNSKDYKLNLQKHREFIVNKLYTFTMAFIDSISSNLFCFPPSLGWLVSHIYNLLSKTNAKLTSQQQQNDARRVCCDLIMALYICPAICDPEPYGVISDIPISVIARHNLMQIAHILQVLAMDDDKETKTQDLYSKFRSNCVSDILNRIIISNSHENYKFYLNTVSTASETASASSLSLQSTLTFQNNNTNNNNILVRTSMMVTLQDTNKLLLFAHYISRELDKDSEEFKWLKNILPTEYLNTLLDAQQRQQANQQQQKIQTDLNNQIDSFLNNSSSATNSSNNTKLKSSISFNKKKPLNEISTTSSRSVDLQAITETSTNDTMINNNDNLESLKVLIININDKGFDCPGMLSEEKVLQEYDYLSTTPSSLLKHGKGKPKRGHKKHDNSSEILLDDRSSSDKISRNDLDENCNENLNNQSISSSNDDDVDDDDVMNRNNDDDDDDDDVDEADDVNENDACQDVADGLSEFNFSGRDTPIISGRDTPSSHSHEDIRRNSSNIVNQISSQNMQMNANNMNNNINNNNPMSNLSRLPVTVHKENREDINEKFCKFEINKVNPPVKEEQLSEAWSLDVDPPESVLNEPIDQTADLSAFFSVRPSQTPQIPSTASSQAPLIHVSSSYNNVENLQFPSNRAESITSDVCSESALSDDRYLNYSDHEQFIDQQQQQNSNSSSLQSQYLQQTQRYNNPLTTFIDAISNKIDEKFNSSPNILNFNQQQQSTILSATNSIPTCQTLSTPTTTSTQSKPKNSLISIFTNSNSNPKQQQQQQQQQLSTSKSMIEKPITQNKKRFANIFGKKNSISKTDTSIANDLVNTLDEAAAASSSVTTATQDADNILKKYSKQNSLQPAQETNQNQELLIQIEDQSSQTSASLPTTTTNQTTLQQQPSAVQQPQQFGALTQFYDASNFEQCKAFQDAKKKLRNVLNWCDIRSFYSSNNFKSLSYLGSGNKENYLTMFLKAQLYEAISLQDTEKEAHLDETMRCIQIFNELECNKLLKSLKGDYKKRVYYISYLTKSKQHLLYCNSFLDKLIQRTDSQHRLCVYHFTSVITRLYLGNKENQVLKFIQKFKLLIAVDEKFDLYKQFLKQLNIDFDQIWQTCTKDEIDYAHLIIERSLMSRVYTYAMFPNGEIDHYRDRKTYECLQDLGKTITPSHPLIAIPPIYHNEAPWNAAQVELKCISAYKTPQDKLNCIRKCMDAIQNLLAIAKTPVCADDLQPVLIYVIIKANPPALLSTVQYIEGFYGKQLDQEFYWSQFMFAFSFIKAKLLVIQ